MAVTTAIGNAGELSVLSEHAHTQNAKERVFSPHTVAAVFDLLCSLY